MRIKLSVLVITSILLPLLTSCQTRSSASSTEVREAVKPLNDTAEALKRKFCEGQTPQEVPPEIYNVLDDFSKKYVRSNVDQWLGAGCEL